MSKTISTFDRVKHENVAPSFKSLLQSHPEEASDGR